MPLEIRELIIRASIGDQAGNQSGKTVPASDDPEETARIVRLCVEQVMRRISEKVER